MFLGPKPSKLEKARKAALEAAQEAASSLSDAASSVSDSAHSLVDKAPRVASAVSDVVSSRVEAVRHKGAEVADNAQDTVEAAQIKAVASRKAAEIAAREAERAARDAQKKADAEIARLEKNLDRKRAEFERQQMVIESQTAKLETKSDTLEAQADEIHTRRKAPLPQIEVRPSIVEVEDEDGNFEYYTLREKEGGSPLWLLIGGAVFVGAALFYFFNPKSGRRARAEATDKLNNVKDATIDKVGGVVDPASKSEGSSTIAEGAPQPSGGIVHAVETYEDSMPSTTSELDAESRVASLDAVDGIAVDSAEEISPIETAATAGAQLDAPQPNIFDKISAVVGHAADVAEHLAGTDQKDEQPDGILSNEAENEGHSPVPRKKKKS